MTLAEGRTKKSARNAVFAIINQFVTIALSFINRSLFIHFLGAEYLGISGLFSDILTMLSLADLGLTSAMAYSYYKPLAEKDEEKISSLLNFYRKIYLVLAIVVMGLGLALIPFLKYIVNLENPIPHIKLYYIILLSNTAVSYLFVYKTTLINADQNNYIISRYTTFVSIVRSILQAILLIVFKSYFVYLLVNVIATLTNNFIASRKADLLYPYIKNKGSSLPQNEKNIIIDNIKSVFIYKTSSVVMNGTDNTIISILIGTVSVGIYSNYNMIIGAINTLVNLIYTSTTASIGNIITKGSKEDRYNTFRMIQALSLLLTTFTTICLASLIGDLIHIWLGEEYAFDMNTTISILINFYIIGIVHPIWSFREATGLFRQTKYIMLISAIVNIVFSILLGKYFGVAGVLYASAISRLSTYFWYEPKMLFKNYFDVSVQEYFIPILKNLFIVLLAVVFVFILGDRFSISTIWSFLFKSIIVALFALVVSVIGYKNTDGYRMISLRIRNIIHRSQFHEE